MTPEEALAERLKFHLARLGWRQSDLARESGLDKNTISSLANGKQRAYSVTIKKLEDALGLTPGMLAGTGETLASLATNGDTLGDLADRGDALADLARLGTDLSRVSTRELLAELTARVIELERGRASEPEQADEFAVIYPALQEVAHRDPSHGKALRKQARALGEESQEEDEAPASIEDLRRRRSAPPSGVFDIAAAGHDDRRERDHEDNEDDEPS